MATVRVMFTVIPLAVDVPGTGLAVIGVLLSSGAIYIAVRHARNLQRVQRHISAAQQQTETLRTETLDALQIHEILVRDEGLGRSVRRIAKEFSRTLDLDDPLLARLARRDLERANESVRMSAEGHREIGEDAFSDTEALASILLEMTEPGDELWASSLVHAEFWARADAYVFQQQEKVSQGVTINRVFVFDTDAAREDSRAQNEMERQLRADIAVHHLVTDKPSRDLVVVRKKDPNALTGYREAYAAEFAVDPSKRVDNIDIWTASGMHTDRVKRLWWSLQGIFHRASDLELTSASNGSEPAESTVPTGG